MPFYNTADADRTLGGGESIASIVKKFQEAIRTRRCSCGDKPSIARGRRSPRGTQEIDVTCEVCDLERRVEARTPAAYARLKDARRLIATARRWR